MGNNQGYIWAPYITVSTTQVVDSSFKSNKLLKSRYATKIVNNSFYGYFLGKKTIRRNKIEKIFELKNPTE